MAKKRKKLKVPKVKAKPAKKKAGKKAMPHLPQVRHKKGGQVKYRASMVQQAELLAEDGRSDVRLAQGLGIGLSTLYAYRKAHKALAAAIERGRLRYVESEVEPAFLSQTIPHDETMEIHELRGRGKKKKMTLTGKRVKKNVVNVTAGERVLKATKPEKYGDKMEHHGEIIVKRVVFGKPDGG